MPCRIYHTLIAAAILFPVQAFAQVMITEIQRNPAGAESASPGGLSHEFVEITNFGIDTFRIDSLFLTDGAESDAIIAWPDSLPAHRDCITGVTALAPGRTALILDPDYAAAIAANPGSRLPIRPATLLLRTEDADLGNGLANDDGILLYKGTKTTVRSVIAYAGDSAVSPSAPVSEKIFLSNPSGVPEGFSIVPTAFLTGKTVFETCADSLTPGYFELLLNGLFAEYRLGDLDTASNIFPCTLACIKSGAALQSPASWKVLVTSNAGTEVVAEGPLSVVQNRGSAICALPLDSAAYQLRITENSVETAWPLDVSVLWTPASPVKINELFPRGNAGVPEWFELVNVSTMPINLRNWTFGNSEGCDTLATGDIVLLPGGYLLAASNSALLYSRYPAKNRVVAPAHWHALDNYNDTLCLWDAKKRQKECVCYRSAWFTGWQSQSLERTTLSSAGTGPESWSLAALPTPGQPNAVRTAATAKLDIGPLPFTPNGDGTNDLLSIAIDLPSGATATAALYGFSGKKLRDFGAYPGRPFLWDGKQDNGAPAPLGPFFVVAEIVSPSGKTTLRKKGIVWR
jgi:hypothetical protein